MTPQSSRYTTSGDLNVYAGEALAIELVILRDGVPIDPTGREGALTLWRTTNRVPILPPIAGETVDGTDVTHGSVKLLRYVLPGSATNLVFTKHRTDCGYQIASANADGLDYRLIGKVLPKASASLGAVPGSGEPPVVALSLETRTQRIVVDARGAPGLAIWEALGLSAEQYRAEQAQAGADAGEAAGAASGAAAGATAGEVAGASAGAAAGGSAGAAAGADAVQPSISAANTAATNADTKAKYAGDQGDYAKASGAAAQTVVDAGAQILVARDQAIAYAPSTFETTDATPRMYLTDAAGRIILELPDPRVAALLGSVAQLNASAIFETTDPGGLSLLDAGGREVLRLPDPAIVAAQLAALGIGVSTNAAALAAQAPLLAAASGSGVFETTDAVAKAYVLDAGGRVVQQFPDPNVAPLLASAATGNVFETTDLSIAAIVLDASGRVAALVPSQAAVAAATPTTVQEVVTARGNMPSLDARLASLLTADAAPIVDRFRRSLLRRTHYLLMKRALPTPESAQLIINAPGDSYTHNASRWSGPTMDVLAARYGDAGGGWCGFGGLASGNVAPWTLANQPSYTNGNVRPSTYPTRLFGSVAQTYFSAASPDLAMATLTQSGDQCFQAFPAVPVHNACDLFFFGTGGGVIRYSWGTYKGSGSAADPANYTFAAASSLNVQGTVDTTQIADIKAGMPAGQGALLVEWVAGTAKLFGVNLKSAAPGVRINKLAATGSAINAWSNAPATQWEVGLAALGAQLVIYMDGTNSQTGGMAAATWGAHLANVVARFRAATPAIDVLIATPPENQRTTNTVPMTAYATEGRKRALTGRFAFADMQLAFGDPANPTEYGSAGAVPLYSSDLIHPDPQTGGRLLAAEIIDFIVPY